VYLGQRKSIKAGCDSVGVETNRRIAKIIGHVYALMDHRCEATYCVLSPVPNIFVNLLKINLSLIRGTYTVKTTLKTLYYILQHTANICDDVRRQGEV
jgi:hypothetical protein